MTEAQGDQVITLLGQLNDLLTALNEVLLKTNAILLATFAAGVALVFFSALKAVRRG